MTRRELEEIFFSNCNKELIAWNEDNIILIHVTPENGQPEYYEVSKLKIAENPLDDSLELIYTWKHDYQE